jgi:lysophospholipase L1-like esterase
MLVLGDSILWGQGLSEDDKCTSILRARWSSATGAPVQEYKFAHSGADIWDDGQSGVLAALNPYPPRYPATVPGDPAVMRTRPSEPTAPLRDAIGEIPDEEPYLLHQILDARGVLATLPPIDLVVVDMGINDTEVYNLILPDKSLPAVVARAKSLAPRVAYAIDKVAEAFPSAKVLVTGYYPLVSKQSDVAKVFQFAKTLVDAAANDENLDVPWLDRLAQWPLVRRVEDGIASLFARDLATRSSAWLSAIHGVLSEAVTTFNRGRSTVVAAFVDPGFGPEHALFAPETLLWRYDDGTPPDPKAGARRRWCDDNGIYGFDRLVIENASLGHPSPAGALRYADALEAQARALGVITDKA